MDQQQESVAANIDQNRLNQLQDAKKPKKSGKKAVIVLLVLILMAGAAFAGWWYSDNEAKKQLTAKDAQIAQLQQEKADLQTKLDEANAAATATDETVPSEEDLTNIKAAIESGNYAALKGYMATEVTVIQAATECCGARTQTQTIEDMAYLNNATKPWDFNLNTETLEAYGGGDYAQYFPEGALVGKSKNNYVVAFTFNDEGKISGVFMTGDAKLLS